MAVHAGLGGRYDGEIRVLDRRVAIAAIDTHGTHMVRMAERDRLFARIPLPRGVGGVCNELENCSSSARNHHKAHRNRRFSVIRWRSGLHNLAGRRPKLTASGQSRRR